MLVELELLGSELSGLRLRCLLSLVLCFGCRFWTGTVGIAADCIGAQGSVAVGAMTRDL